MAIHTLEPTEATRHGWYSRDHEPVLTIDPGDTVRLSPLDCWWSAGPHPTGTAPPDWPREPGWQDGTGHALEGPIAVRGAEPGMVLEVRIDRLVPGRWGNTAAGGYPGPHNARYGFEREGAVLHWDLDPDALTGRNQLGHRVALKPFLGVIGMPPDAPGRHSTIPPRRTGGNLDCRDLVAGSTLYLPIEVPGALLSAGDGHAAQGDGETGGTAIECPLELAELTVGLREDLPLTGPVARTAEGWLTLGLGDTLDEATADALEGMFALLHRLHGVSRAEAFALAGVVVDLRVTQIVNQTVGVHAVLPDGALG